MIPLTGGLKWLELFPFSEKVAGSLLGLGPFRVELACPPCVRMGVLHILYFLPQNKSMQIMLTGISTWSVGMGKIVRCLSRLCVHVMDLLPIQDVSHVSHSDCWRWASTTLRKGKRKWMDV